MVVSRKYLRVALLFIAVAVVGGIVAIFCLVAFLRYPTEEEVRERFSGLDSVGSLSVDWVQADVGYFRITTEGAEGSEEFFIETTPQWVFPWSSYGWNRP